MKERWDLTIREACRVRLDGSVEMRGRKSAAERLTRDNPDVIGTRRFWKDADGQLVCRELSGKLLRGPLALKQYIRSQRLRAQRLEGKVKALKGG